MRILIAEDDATSRRILDKTLTRWGYEVVSTRDGAEAWKILQTEDRPPIAILDWEMPEIDGIELIRRIRANQRSDYIYTFLLTAKSGKQDIIAGIESGADDYLSKPFDQNELRARLRTGERIINLEQTLAEKNQQLGSANLVISAANARMSNDLEAAAKIQQTLLPKTPPEIDGAEVSWLYKPCDELAGDILNAFWLDDKHLALYLLDVSGHGVSAALLSVTLSRILSPIAGQSSMLRINGNGAGQHKIVSPAKVADNLNIRFQLDPETGQYFTLIYGILNTETYEFRFVNAGHPNPFLLSQGKCSSPQSSTGLPIGFLEEQAYEEKTLQLKPGDRLYFYSDGITETMRNDEQFGADRLQKLAHQHSRENLKNNLDSIISGVEAFSGNEKFIDDISMMAIEIKLDA